jgi:hypothetical protein
LETKKHLGGRPPSSDPKLGRVSVRLTPDEYARAYAQALDEGVSIPEVLRRSLARPSSAATMVPTIARDA